MPINGAQFEKGRSVRAFYFRILEFLEENRGKAYTAQEIDTGMRPTNLQDGWAGLLNDLTAIAVTFATLENLLRDGKVTARVVEDTTGRQDSPKKNVYFMTV